MKSAGSVVIFLTLISNGFMLDLKVFWSILHSPFATNPTQIVEEPDEPIEIVTWRQPLCLMPAEGVSPCYLELQKLQEKYDSDHLQKTNLRSSSLSLNKARMSLGTAADASSAGKDLPSLQSSEGSEEAIGSLRSRTPELPTNLEKDVRRTERMYPGFGRRATPKPRQIYVTRVVNAPTTATLVAHNCLPDIGIPLCRDYEPLPTSQPVAPPDNSENPIEQVIHSNQTFDNPVKPIPTTRPSEAPQSSLCHEACHFCDLNCPAPGKLEHVVISIKPASDEVVETKARTVAGVSPCFESASEVPDQRIKTELGIQLSRNSGSPEIEGHRPGVESSEGKRNTIFRTIHDIVNRAESLPVLQKLQSLVKETSGHRQGSSGGILGNIFRPINLFNRKKGTTPRPVEIVQNRSASSTPPQPMKASGIAIEREPAIMDILYKPENNISNGSGLLDIFESAGDNGDAESLAKPAGKPGLLGDLFADPVEPIEPENGKVEAEGN